MLKDLITTVGTEEEIQLQPEAENPNEIWFDDIENDLAYSQDEGEVLARYLAAAIFDGKPIDEAIQYVRVDDSPRMIYLSLSDGTAPSMVLLAQGYGIQSTLTTAAAQAQEWLANGFDLQWLTVDIVGEVYRVHVGEPASPMDTGYERDLHGFAFDRGISLAFLPGEIVGYSLIDSDNRLRFDHIRIYLASRQENGDLVGKLEHTSGFDGYRFKTNTYFADGDEAVRMYRNHRIFEQVSPDDMLTAAINGGDYLARSVGPQGKFVYTYYPKSDTDSDDYNILRHAGSVYAMLELYEMTRDPDLLAASERAIGYLVEHTRPCEFAGSQYICVVEGGEVKLGGNSLAILALAKYRQVSGSTAYDQLIRSLGEWILAVQDDSGEFTVHKMVYTSGDVFDFDSEYYPGEALLAMLRMYAYDGDEIWLNAAEKGALWLIQVRDGGLSIAELKHDHWLLYALNELYRYRPHQVFIDHSFKIANSIMQAQNRAPRYPDWLGGYYQEPRATPTASRSEGLVAAYLLARDFGYQQQADDIMEALDLGIVFQLQNQFRPESLMYVRDPQRCLGGFHHSLSNYQLRIDFTQHNLSSLLGAYRLKLGQ